MSARKKNGGEIQQIYANILEAVAKTKPQLNSPTPALIDELHRVASLAHSFTSHRVRHPTDSHSDFADSLDQEGVNLWNITGTLRKSPDSDGGVLTAALQLAAFRLVEAGLEANPGAETLCSILQMASKAGTSFSELGNHDIAGALLTCAAKYEDLLKAAPDPDGTHRQSKALSTTQYYCSRMDAAWNEDNRSLAEYMSGKMTDEDRVGLLQPQHKQLLAIKLHCIGSKILGSSVTDVGENAQEAIPWLQKAISLTDHFEDSTVKISILRTLARAYFNASAYDRAEATLEELVPTIDSEATDSVSGNGKYHELRWLRLAVVKKRKAGTGATLQAYKSIISHMPFAEFHITDVLQDLRSIQQRDIVSAVHQHAIEEILRRKTAETVEDEALDRFLLSLIVHSSKDACHQDGIRTIEQSLDVVAESTLNLGSAPTNACITLIWRTADQHYYGKRWREAAEWYLLGAHKLLDRSGNQTNVSALDGPSANPTTTKCFRKAALCHLEQREYAMASTILRRCSLDEASTHYVTFLAAVAQGLEDEAIRAVNNMLLSPTFDRKILLLATQVAHEKSDRIVLLSVLQALLRSYHRQDSDDESIVETMNLIRCIIRMAIKLLREPASNRRALEDVIVKHLLTATELAVKSSSRKSIGLIIKDVQWLWRTAYNFAVDCCTEEGMEADDFERYHKKICELFEVTASLIDVSLEASLGDPEPELYLYFISSSFSAVSGKVFMVRERIRDNVDVLGDIQDVTNRTIAIISKNVLTRSDDIERCRYFLHVLRVYSAEVLVHLKDWDSLLAIVKRSQDGDSLAASTFEAMADILWEEKDCPVHILHHCLEAILHASLNHSALSVEKFSRWLRAICTISLARNTEEDRIKAIGYVEQAVSVMEEHQAGDDMYPMDERNWLLSSSYNTGYECLKASVLDEAKRWFEVSTVICKYVPNGAEQEEKISQSYGQLLDLYSKRQTHERSS